MYDQLPMQVSLMERNRERDALMREAEVRRDMDHGPPVPGRLPGLWAAARDRLAALARPRTRQSPAALCQAELGSSPVA